MLDAAAVIAYDDTKLMKAFLIQSGGGTGPMKPDNQHTVHGVNSCRI